MASVVLLYVVQLSNVQVCLEVTALACCNVEAQGSHLQVLPCVIFVQLTLCCN